MSHRRVTPLFGEHLELKTSPETTETTASTKSQSSSCSDGGVDEPLRYDHHQQQLLLLMATVANDDDNNKLPQILSPTTMQKSSGRNNLCSHSCHMDSSFHLIDKQDTSYFRARAQSKNMIELATPLVEDSDRSLSSGLRTIASVTNFSIPAELQQGTTSIPASSPPPQLQQRNNHNRDQYLEFSPLVPCSLYSSSRLVGEAAVPVPEVRLSPHLEQVQQARSASNSSQANSAQWQRQKQQILYPTRATTSSASNRRSSKTGHETKSTDEQLQKQQSTQGGKRQQSQRNVKGQKIMKLDDNVYSHRDLPNTERLAKMASVSSHLIEPLSRKLQNRLEKLITLPDHDIDKAVRLIVVPPFDMKIDGIKYYQRKTKRMERRGGVQGQNDQIVVDGMNRESDQPLRLQHHLLECGNSTNSTFKSDGKRPSTAPNSVAVSSSTIRKHPNETNNLISGRPPTSPSMSSPVLVDTSDTPTTKMASGMHSSVTNAPSTKEIQLRSKQDNQQHPPAVQLSGILKDKVSKATLNSESINIVQSGSDHDIATIMNDPSRDEEYRTAITMTTGATAAVQVLKSVHQPIMETIASSHSSNLATDSIATLKIESSIDNSLFPFRAKTTPLRDHDTGISSNTNINSPTASSLLQMSLSSSATLTPSSLDTVLEEIGIIPCEMGHNQYRLEKEEPKQDDDGWVEMQQVWDKRRKLATTHETAEVPRVDPVSKMSMFSQQQLPYKKENEHVADVESAAVAESRYYPWHTPEANENYNNRVHYNSSISSVTNDDKKRDDANQSSKAPSSKSNLTLSSADTTSGTDDNTTKEEQLGDQYYPSLELLRTMSEVSSATLQEK